MSTSVPVDAGLVANTQSDAHAPPVAGSESNPRMLLAVLELGVLGDILLRAGGLGVNIMLWCWALLVAGGLTARDIPVDRRRVALLVAAAFFASVPALRSDEMLVFLS